MRGHNRIVISDLEQNLPFYVSNAKQKLAEFDSNENNRAAYSEHISQYGSDIVFKLENYMLELQSNKLPLQQTFIKALKAKCLAVQRSIDSFSKNFCREYVFRATKFDTQLEFLGSGLVFLDNKHKNIKGVMYTFKTSIPILDEIKLPRFSISNLGRYIEKYRIKKAYLPSNAVLSRSNQLEPLEISACIKLKRFLVCPPHAISFHNSCLQSIFANDKKDSCQTRILNVHSSCQTKISEKFVLVSSFNKPRIIFNSHVNRHLAKTHPLRNFDIIPKNEFKGQFYCSVHIKDQDVLEPVIISKLPREDQSSVYDHAYLTNPNMTVDLPKAMPGPDGLLKIEFDIMNQTKFNEETLKNTLANKNLTLNHTTLLDSIQTTLESYSLENLFHKIVTGIVLLSFFCLALYLCLSGRCKKMKTKRIQFVNASDPYPV